MLVAPARWIHDRAPAASSNHLSQCLYLCEPLALSLMHALRSSCHHFVLYSTRPSPLCLVSKGSSHVWMLFSKRLQLTNTVAPPLPCGVRNSPQPWCQLPAGAASWDVHQRSMLLEPCFLADGPGLEPTRLGCSPKPSRPPSSHRIGA